MLNTYTDSGANDSWSVQVFDASTGVVHSDNDAHELPLIKGRWVKLHVEIDLNNDLQRFYYDGQLLYEKSWSCGVQGCGAINIGAVDLFANGASPIYYDDLRLAQGPTAVTVSSFAAQPQAAGVQLAWQTLMEIDMLGFNVYRSSTPDGAPGWQKLNATLIPATALGGVQGQSYEYIDDQVQPGLRYYYWLEAVTQDGTQLFGPRSAGQLSMLFLPAVSK